MAESVTSAVPSSFASMPGWLFFADVWLSLCVAVGKRDVGRAESSHPIGGTRNGAGVGTVCERRRSLDDESGEGGGHINHNTPEERTAPQTRSQGARTKVAARPGEEGWRTCALGRNAK